MTCCCADCSVALECSSGELDPSLAPICAFLAPPISSGWSALPLWTSPYPSWAVGRFSSAFSGAFPPKILSGRILEFSWFLELEPCVSTASCSPLLSWDGLETNLSRAVLLRPYHGEELCGAVGIFRRATVVLLLSRRAAGVSASTDWSVVLPFLRYHAVDSPIWTVHGQRPDSSRV